jgi:hypothetical protein
MGEWKSKITLDTNDGIPVCSVCEQTFREGEEVFAIPPHSYGETDDEAYTLICLDCMDTVCGYKDVHLLEPDDMTDV